MDARIAVTITQKSSFEGGMGLLNEQDSKPVSKRASKRVYIYCHEKTVKRATQRGFVIIPAYDNEENLWVCAACAGFGLAAM